MRGARGRVRITRKREEEKKKGNWWRSEKKDENFQKKNNVRDQEKETDRKAKKISIT